MLARAVRRLLALLTAVLLSLVSVATGATPVQHLTTHTKLESGRSRVIAFAVTEAAESDRTFAAKIEPASAGRVLQAPAVLAGETIGFIRVLGGDPGPATLTVDGALLTLNVQPAPADPLGFDLPRIVGPAEGAVVWGTISVGVSMRFSPHDALRRIVLRLEDNTELEAWEDSGRLLAPTRQLRFEVETDDLAPGLHTLTPVILEPNGEQTVGRPVRIVVQPPAEVNLTVGEAEAQYDVERPQRFADSRRNIGQNRGASDGRYFANSSATPAVCFPVEVESPGWYQVVVRAGGTRAKGILPTIALIVDDNREAATNGRVLGENWHRIAVGVPIPLDAGTHIITPYFANDFYVAERSDRNLKLDVIEVARVADRSADSNEDEAALAMQAGRGVVDFAANGPEAMELNDPLGLRDEPLRVALRTALDQRVIAGIIAIEGRCWWPAPAQSPPPRVSLVINGQPVATQRTAAPRYWVDPGHFVAGENTVQLVARTDEGLAARTPIITLYRPSDVAADTVDPVRDHRRITIHEAGWQAGPGATFSSEANPTEYRALVLPAESSGTLELPEEMTGRHLLLLECRRDGGAATTVSAELEVGSETIEIGQCNVPGWWGEPIVGWVDLPEGPKRLRLHSSEGNATVRVQGALLARDGSQPDRTPPHIAVHYPADQHSVWMADAIVMTVADDRALASIEILLDDRETGLTRDMTLAAGDVTVPLPLRTLTPGDHTISVRAVDRAGNSVLSEPRTIRVLAEAPADAGPYRRAVHLLNRLAYGPDERELGAILTHGIDAWLAKRLHPHAGYDAAERSAIAIAATSFPERGAYQVARRVVAQRLVTTNPVRARLEGWVENHFSTWINKIQGPRKWQEHLDLGARVTLGFDHLLFASAEGPAMMAYLDQVQSYEGQLNENYAREVMELHTVGVHGGYDQGDVTRLARLLTGWTIATQGDGRGGTQNALIPSFRFDPALGSGDALRVMGMHFPETPLRMRYDRTRQALEMLAAHPATSRFVAGKLAAHYLGESVPPEIVDALATRYLETGGNLAAMLHDLVRHPAFFAAPAGERLAHPLDFALRLCRQTAHRQPWMIADFLQRSGSGYYDRATPDGYPEEDLAYADSNAFMQRWRFARELQWPIHGLVPGAWRGGGAADDRWTQMIIDVIAIRLTGDVLSPASNAAAQELAAALTGNRSQRVQRLGPFIAHLPEVNLR